MSQGVSVELEYVHLGEWLWEVSVDGEVKGHRIHNKETGEDRYFANRPRFVTQSDAELFSEPGVRPWCYDEHPDYLELFYATFSTLNALVEFIRWSKVGVEQLLNEDGTPNVPWWNYAGKYPVQGE